MIKEKLACVIFPSQCNIVFGNAFVLVSKGKLASCSFLSWCNVFHGNAFVQVIE